MPEHVISHALDPGGLPADIGAELFVAWISHFASERFSATQNGTGGTSEVPTFTFGDPTNNHFVLDRVGMLFTLQSSADIPESEISVVLEDAQRQVTASDFGPDHVFRVPMTIRALTPFDMHPHFMRALSDRIPISGRRRLSDRVVLDFGASSEATPIDIMQSHFRADQTIDALIFAPGPTSTGLTTQAAAGMAELAAAICALAVGHPVDYTPPMFDLEDDEAQAAFALQRDPSIGGLARSSISLDIFGDLALLGGTDGQLRVRGALLAYHAALRQESPDVAVMLFVTAIEALVAPNQPWGTEKVTKRFIESVIDLCPDTVDSIVNHENVRGAFNFQRRGGLRRQRQDVLNLIYASRSAPTHTGLTLSRTGMLTMVSPGSLRVALMSDLARDSILAFLKSPRSSLIGHPLFEQEAQA
jgi:hypothetical protein